jgi:acid phosphatase family membrane protein YuiD
MSTDLVFPLMPFVAWLASGVLKFCVNSLRNRRLAFDLIGYGGFPSTHSTIVSSTVTLIALKEGLSSPALGVAVTLAVIVVIDALSLRKQMGAHATRINLLCSNNGVQIGLLRERMGHSRNEVLAGILVGFCVAALLDALTR